MKSNFLKATFVLLAMAYASASFAGFHASKERIKEDQEKIRNEFSTLEAPTLAIVGDSSVTGAAANPEIAARWSSLLWESLMFASESTMTDSTPYIENYKNPEDFHITKPLGRVTRAAYLTDEFLASDEATKRKINLDFKAALKLDVEEYTFGYMVGRYLGVQPKDMIFVGSDGEKARTLSYQMKVIFETGIKTLPELVLVSYVANDFCDPGHMKRTTAEFEQYFHDTLFSQLPELQKLPAHKKGTRVVILAPLDVTQILTSDALLKQMVPIEGYEGEMISCKEFRQQGVDYNPLKIGMKYFLTSECKSVLRGKDNMDPARIAKVGELQAAQVKVWQEFIAEAQVQVPQIQWTFAPSSRKIEFETGDLANDCFHPGIGGHESIARQLLQNELKGFKFKRFK